MIRATAHGMSGGVSAVHGVPGGPCGFVLRLKTLNRKTGGANIILKAARHNRRATAAEVSASPSINATLSHLNETIAGPPQADDVAALARQRMADAGVVLRRDAVLGIEVVVSLPPGHGLDEREFFTACTDWLGQRFGGARNVLSSDIHRDEAAPHCHILLLPLLGGKLAASKLLGNRDQFAAMQDAFFKDVALRFGLAKPTAKLAGASKAAAAAAVLKHMREANDTAMRSQAWAAIRESIERHPEPFLMELGVQPTPSPAKAPKPRKSFTQIMTGKGRTTAQDAAPYRTLTVPQGDMSYRTSTTDAGNVLSCVGRSSPPSPKSSPPCRSSSARPTAQAERLEVDDGYERVREADQDPALFDTVTGEHRKRGPLPERRCKADSAAWVADALSRRQRLNSG